MPITLFPTFGSNKAVTLRAIFNACNMSLPNINQLPDSKDQKVVALAAAKQVARAIRDVHSTKALDVIKGFKHTTMVPSSFLFPQLGLLYKLCGYGCDQCFKYVGKCPYCHTKLPAGKTFSLASVYGKHVDAIAERLATLPHTKVVFYLDADDDIGDAALLSELSFHPKLKKHRFLMSRPMHSEYYAGKPGKATKNGKKTKVEMLFEAAIIQCTHREYLRFKVGNDPRVEHLRCALKAGGFLIFD